MSRMFHLSLRISCSHICWQHVSWKRTPETLENLSGRGEFIKIALWHFKAWNVKSWPIRSAEGEERWPVSRSSEMWCTVDVSSALLTLMLLRSNSPQQAGFLVLNFIFWGKRIWLDLLPLVEMSLWTRSGTWIQDICRAARDPLLGIKDPSQRWRNCCEKSIHKW